MLSPIDPQRIPEPHRALISQYPLINAVASGAQAGLIYADPSRTCVFIATKSGFSLASSLSSDHGPSFGADLFQFLNDTREIPRYLHLYRRPPPLDWHLDRHVTRFKRRRRAQFRHYASTTSFGYEDLLPPGHRIATVQEVGVDGLEEAFQLDFARRYWNSTEDFLSKAIGACLMSDQDVPLAICYSACVIDGVAEMDTLVAPAHRGRRFMRVVSEPFFNLAISHRLIPHWDTFTANLPSYVLAQKLGLALVQEYDLVSVLLA